MITIHILPNISRSKDNQTTKFGQLIEYDTKNIFFKKSYKKCGAEISPKRFSKKSKLRISLNQQSAPLYYLFLLYVQFDDYKNVLQLRCWSLA